MLYNKCTHVQQRCVQGIWEFLLDARRRFLLSQEGQWLRARLGFGRHYIMLIHSSNNCVHRLQQLSWLEFSFMSYKYWKHDGAKAAPLSRYVSCLTDEQPTNGERKLRLYYASNI